MATGAYSSRVLIGNWSEDLELEQAKLREYLDRKERHGMTLGRTIAATADVSLSVSEDGCLHVGERLMLLSECTSGFLSIDLADAAAGCGAPAFHMSSSLAERATARATFVLMRAEEALPGSDDGRIRYGDKIRLCSHEGLSARPLYVHSQLATPSSYSRKSRFQEVVACAKPSWLTVWEFVHFDPLLRFEAEGRLVPANGRVLVRHCGTNTLLASPLAKVVTSHGEECEVCAHTYLNVHKAETAENHWIAVVGVAAEPPVAEAAAESQQQPIEM
eukprot:c25932_g1_i1.p2 GENE.c25932_g1_i1~~c25932_g1_i1.p2  ORF type:complete len:275 (+),score=50.72 c25932_g1_i1:198-1022(+)